MSFQPLSKVQLARLIRRHLATQIYDDSSAPSEGAAIYSLADPRDLRLVRYVGQSKSPRRRFLQHLNTARLWLPDDQPWWVKSPRLRPLYGWLRELHRDEYRLPTMVITAWAQTTKEARVAERNRIYECLALQMPLLNIETEILRDQIALI